MYDPVAAINKNIYNGKTYTPSKPKPTPVKNSNGWSLSKAWDNATTRAGNTLANGGGTLSAIGSMFAPNRTKTGNTIYNQPMLFADARSDSQSSGNDASPTVTDAGNPAGSGSGTTLAPNQAVGLQSGAIYDMNDPAQAQKYYDEKNQWVDAQYNQNKTQWETGFNRQNEDLTNTRKSLDTSKKQFYGDESTGFKGDWQQGQEDLTNGFQGRNARTMRGFNAMSPNVYQSAEGEELDKSKNMYDTAQTDANFQKQGVEDNFNTTQSNIDRVAQDLTNEQQGIKNYNGTGQNYFDWWKQQQSGNNTIDKNTALDSISRANTTRVTNNANQPTFAERSLNLYNQVANLNGVPDSLGQSLTGTMAQRAGVNVSPTYYGDAMAYAKLANDKANGVAVDENKMTEYQKRLFGTQY